MASGSNTVFVTPQRHDVSHGDLLTLDQHQCVIHAWVKFASDNIRPPLLPPAIQEKALHFQIRIHTMPFNGGQPLPRRLCTCPALAVIAAAVPDPSHRALASILPAGGFRSRVSAPGQKEPHRRGVG